MAQLKNETHGLSAIWDNFSWDRVSSPEILPRFKSQTTGTVFEAMPNLYDVRHWVLSFSEYLQIFIYAIIWFFISKYAITYFKKRAVELKIEPKNRLRYANSSWKSIFYVFSFSWGVLIAYLGNYYPDTTYCWIGFPVTPYVPSLDLFYLLQLGFYVYSIYALFDVEEKRSDSLLLLIHHVVTIGLIYSSIVVGLKRSGVLVILLHDVSDIFLELAKTFAYKTEENKKTFCFLMLLISWAISRLWIFPFHVIGSIYFETPAYIPIDRFFFVWVYFLLFLSLLYLMHLYWFYLMLRIVYKKVAHGEEVSDDREDEEPQTFKKTE